MISACTEPYSSLVLINQTERLEFALFENAATINRHNSHARRWNDNPKTLSSLFLSK